MGRSTEKPDDTRRDAIFCVSAQHMNNVFYFGIANKKTVSPSCKKFSFPS